MDIKDKNLLNAYNKADESSKEMLRALFPDFDFKTQEEDTRDITERVKTFEDAFDWCATNGRTDLTEAFDNAHEWLENDQKDVIAYLKLRIICAALNEGWQPKFTEEEWRWQPWFCLWTADELSEKTDEWKRSHALIMTEGEYTTEYAGFSSAHSDYVPSYTDAYIGSRLCLKSEALSDYCGRQFAALWADFYLIRK